MKNLKERLIKIYSRFHLFCKKIRLHLVPRKCRVIIYIFILLLSVTAGCFSIYTLLIKRPDTSCDLVFSVGDVTVKSGEKIFSPENGYVFQEKDIISTGEMSTAYINAGNGTTVRISPLTVFCIGTIKDSENVSVREFTMDKGRIAAASKKLKKKDNISVKTPTVVVAVRGTLFTVAFDGIESRVSVNEGKVEVNSSDGSAKNFLSNGQSVRSEDNILLDDHITKDEDSDMKECIDVSNKIEQDDDEIEPVIRSHRDRIERHDAEEKQEHKHHAEKAEGTVFCVGVLPFSGNNIGRHLLKELTDDIARGIEREKDDDQVINLRKHEDRRNDANRILSGTIEKSGDGFVITARMIDTETSDLLYEFSGIAETEHKVSVIAKKIAKEAASKMEKKKPDGI